MTVIPHTYITCIYRLHVHVTFIHGLRLCTNSEIFLCAEFFLVYGSPFITPLYAYVSKTCPLLHSLLSTMPCFSPCQPLLASGLTSRIRCKLCWRRCPKEGMLLAILLWRTITQQHVTQHLVNKLVHKLRLHEFKFTQYQLQFESSLL